MVGDRSAHLPKALDHELQRGDLIFQREDTSTGCQLTGQYTAGEGLSRGQDSMKREVEVRRISHWGRIIGRERKQGLTRQNWLSWLGSTARGRCAAHLGGCQEPGYDWLTALTRDCKVLRELCRG